MNIENQLKETIVASISDLFDHTISAEDIALQPTRKEFEGDFTLVVFPFVKFAKRSPEQTAIALGNEIKKRMPTAEDFNVVKGFLNIVLSKSFWIDFLQHQYNRKQYGYTTVDEKETVVIEYSSPNTNKPLHLGHIRNNLLGYSLSEIVDAAGKRAVKVNLVNDRGIHICKSMLAWMKWGKGETPEKAGKKGDKLVGDYYVMFETELRKQAKEISEKEGLDNEKARNIAPLMKEARELLLKWENRDAETVRIWKMMNQWVYDGFDVTYKRMGVDFDKIYYESETYLLGKEIVLQGLNKKALFQKEDQSVWADLSDEGLDQKLLLRADGTSVYMTQDIGTAQLRYNDYQPSRMIYVVGNEQNYHFDVLKKVLKKLEKPYADTIFHLSYGMVELPQGKMKSREGTVVDADDLMEQMYNTAKSTTEQLGKIDDFSEKEKEKLFHMIGMGALKYFILKVDPKKNMLFNPEESIDFNGNTGPFIQYTHARICSILRKAEEKNLNAENIDISQVTVHEKEKLLLRQLYAFPNTVKDSAQTMSPALIANYVYELSKAFNQFYHDHSVLNEPDKKTSVFRLMISVFTSNVIKNAMHLLGIDVPERM
ncbi:MAG: arginine--tRNA ligase [Bacteroidota bacterium]